MKDKAIIKLNHILCSHCRNIIRNLTKDDLKKDLKAEYCRKCKCKGKEEL